MASSTSSTLPEKTINLGEKHTRSSEYITDDRGHDNSDTKKQEITANGNQISPPATDSIGSHSLSARNSIAKGTEGAEKVAEETAEPSDPNVVWWDGPEDPSNPLNFSPKLKLLNIGLVSAICFVTPLASSMFAPGVPDLMKEFESKSRELGSFVVSGML